MFLNVCLSSEYRNEKLVKPVHAFRYAFVYPDSLYRYSSIANSFSLSPPPSPSFFEISLFALANVLVGSLGGEKKCKRCDANDDLQHRFRFCFRRGKVILRRGTQFERFQTTVESFGERCNISLEHYGTVCDTLGNFRLACKILESCKTI